MKLVFEIAVAQQTDTCDLTLRGSWTPTAQRHILAQFLPNHQNMAKSNIFGALLVASGRLNSYIKFNPDKQKMVEL